MEGEYKLKPISMEDSLGKLKSNKMMTNYVCMAVFGMALAFFSFDVEDVLYVATNVDLFSCHNL